METAVAWSKLAYHARRIANEMRDPYGETLMREIAARYELLATRRARGSGRYFDGRDPPPPPAPPPPTAPAAAAGD